MKILLAVLLSAAIFWLHPRTSPANLNNSTQSTNVQTVQAVAPEKVTAVQTAAQTEPQPVVEPERKLSPKEDLMQQAGIPEHDWGAVDYIVTRESSWNYSAVNKASGAFGLCQALPATKMASAGGDYRTNPVTQLKWCHQYAHARYGGWWSSFAFWRSNKWW